MKIHPTRKGLGQLARAAGFLLLAGCLFLFFTYLFRNDSTNRKSALAFHEEEKDTIDLVFIGASSVYRYWDPIEAYKQAGITSYSYSFQQMSSGVLLTAVKDVMKAQSPNAVAVEIRSFLRDRSDQGFSLGVRNYLDSLPFDLDRLRGADYFRRVTDMSFADASAGYLDLMLYHSNYEALTSPSHWALADNRLGDEPVKFNYFKGYYLVSKQRFMEEPTDALTHDRTPLDPVAEKCYRDLVSWCSENDVPLVMVAAPFALRKEECEKINMMAAIAAEYGIPFLNTNFAYRQMGLDFDSDFYNRGHTNASGAVKFTDYMCRLFTSLFDLPDRRGEPQAASYEALIESHDDLQEKAMKIIADKVAQGPVDDSARAAEGDADEQTMDEDDEGFGDAAGI